MAKRTKRTTPKPGVLEGVIAPLKEPCGNWRKYWVMKLKVSGIETRMPRGFGGGKIRLTIKATDSSDRD